MERSLTIKPLSIQDENSAIHRKKAAVDGKSKTSKPVAKKGGGVLESRKALNDITNKASIRLEASSHRKSSENKKGNIVEGGFLQHHVSETEAPSKKKSSVNEKPNFAQEGFLHDHNKCIEAQAKAFELNFWDTVLPGHDSIDQNLERTKSDPVDDSVPELVELSMPEFCEWFESWWKSPSSSPIRWDSPPHSPFPWELEPAEFILKEDALGDAQGPS